jgi:DNA ligase D-like protein (predicted 3'-phosphoesterase)
MLERLVEEPVARPAWESAVARRTPTRDRTAPNPEVCVSDQRGRRRHRPVFVLHEHLKPQHHFDLRLEENGVLRSWAVPRGLPTTPKKDRLAVPVPDHALEHATYEDATKSIADTGWWELEDRNDRRTVFVLHGREAARRYALVSTDQGALLHLVKDQPAP